jgi:hypothetical protein
MRLVEEDTTMRKIAPSATGLGLRERRVPNEAIMNKLLILMALALAILGVTATIERLLPQTQPIVIADCSSANC